MSHPSPDFEGQLNAVLDGTADRDQRELFRSGLREHPELLDAYIEQAEVHASLLAMSDVTAGARASEPGAGKLRRAGFRALSGGWWKAAAAAVLLAGAAAWSVGHLPGVGAARRTGTPPRAVAAAGRPQRPQVLAKTRTGADRITVRQTWFAQGLKCGVKRSGTQDGGGQDAREYPFIQLDCGAVAFSIGPGVTARLCGPAEARLNEDGLLLTRGYLTVRTEEEGHGFTVNTAHARIVDFGTAFAVDARAEEATDVIVTEGQVHVACINDPVQETLLGAGQSALVKESSLVFDADDTADVYSVKRQIKDTQFRNLSVQTKEMLMGMMPNGVTVGMVAAFLAVLPADMQTMAAEVTTLSTTAAAVVNGADAPGSRYTLQVDSAEALAGLTIGGTLVKTGAGALTLQNNGFPEGGLEILSGAATLDAAAASVTNELPLYLRNSLALWLDANRNVVMNPTNSTVDEWRDVRDDVTVEATNCVYTRAVRYLSNSTPVPTGPLAAVKGLQALDFGAYGSGRWLDWVNPNGSFYRISGVRTLFLVLAPPAGGMGFVLGDWNHATSGGGAKDFHKGSPAGSAGGTILSGSEIPMAAGWAARRNGSRINATQTTYASGYQLLEVVTTNALSLSNFCNDRNWRNGIDGYAGISRQGGSLIGEVLIFTRELPETERRAVAAYLNAKWFSKNAAGKVTVALGATATAEVAEDDVPFVLNGIAGSGTFEKAGDGTLSLGWASDLFTGQTFLRAGTLDGNGFVRRMLPLTLTQGGLAADAVGHAVTVSPQAGEATRFSKSGDGVLGVAAVTNSITRLTVGAGTLRLQPGLLATNAAESFASLPNPSFETNTLGGNSYSASATAAGWVFEAETLVNGGQQKSNLTKGAGSGSPLCGAVMPDGTVGAYIQRAAKITAQVAFSEAGVYRLTFWVVGRPNRPYGDQYVAVYVDGVMGGVVVASATNAFVKYTCTLPAVTQGTHELVIRGLRDDQDRTAVVDHFTFEPVRTGHFAMLPNEGFEFTTSVGTQHPAYPGSAYMYGAANAGWQFEITTDPAGGSGITDAGGTWTRTVLEGSRAAFLQRTGTMSAPVIFPETGRYRLTFLAAARREKTGLDFAVRLGGVELGRFQPLSELFTTYVLMLPEQTAGTTNTLTFAGLNNNNADSVDRCAVIDQVIVERISDIYDADNGFENGLNVWQFGSPANRSGIVSFGASNDVAAVEGTHAALVQGTAAFWRSVTPAASGVFQLSFAAAGRQAVSKNYLHYAHDFKVLFGGVEVGQVTTEDDAFRRYAFRRYAFRLPYAQAGSPVELRFVGLNSQGRSESFSLIDDVRLEPLATRAPGTVIAKSTELDIAEGATLDLDFGGTIRLENVRYGGRSVSGVISAATQPLFVSGSGALYASPKGTMISLK